MNRNSRDLVSEEHSVRSAQSLLSSPSSWTSERTHSVRSVVSPSDTEVSEMDLSEGYSAHSSDMVNSNYKMNTSEESHSRGLLNDGDQNNLRDSISLSSFGENNSEYSGNSKNTRYSTGSQYRDWLTSKNEETASKKVILHHKDIYAQDKYIRNIRNYNLSQLFDDGNKIHEELQSPEPFNSFPQKGKQDSDEIFQKIMEKLYQSRYLRKWIIPCLVFTPILLTMFVMYSFPNWSHTFSLLLAVSPSISFPILNLLHYDSATLQYLSMYLGMVMVVISIILEMIFNYSVLSILHLFDVTSVTDLLFVSSYNKSAASKLQGMTLFYYTLSSCIYVGVVEEILKYCIPLLVFHIFIRDSNLVYSSKNGKKDLLMSLRIIALTAISAAIGFSILENVKYANVEYFDQAENEISTTLKLTMKGLERVLVTTPGHITFSLIAIIGLGERCLRRRLNHDSLHPESKVSIAIRASCWLLLSIICHGFYDFLKILSDSMSFYGDVMILVAQLIIPMGVFIFIYFYSKLCGEWYELIQSQVIEVDGKDEEKSVSLLLSRHIASELDAVDDIKNHP